MAIKLKFSRPWRTFAKGDDAGSLELPEGVSVPQFADLVRNGVVVGEPRGERVTAMDKQVVNPRGPAKKEEQAKSGDGPSIAPVATKPSNACLGITVDRLVSDDLISARIGEALKGGGIESVGQAIEFAATNNNDYTSISGIGRESSETILAAIEIVKEMNSEGGK